MFFKSGVKYTEDGQLMGHSPRDPSVQNSELRKKDFKSEMNRIKSFDKWSPFHPLGYLDLVNNGFYHKGPGDNVCCVFCKCELGDWEANDNIEEKHWTISPNCPFLCDKNIVNEPKAPRREILSNRRKHPVNDCFDCPKDEKQRPEDLAEAGSFHNGVVSESIKNEGSSYNQDSYRQDDAENPEDFTTFPNTPELAILPMNRSLKFTLSCLDTPTVQAVLSIGYKKSIVKRIIKRKIKETGSSFSKASLLLEAIHKCPDFEEDVEVSDKDEPRPQTDAVAEAKVVTAGVKYTEDGQLMGHSIRDPSVQNSELRKKDFKSEMDRIKSFDKWSPCHPLGYLDLVKNGFYHKGPGDNVSCVFCNCELRDWEANDNIEEKHRTISPNCPFLCDKNIGNEPKTARCEPLSNRRKRPTFLNEWFDCPKDEKRRPDDLAEAGSFHNATLPMNRSLKFMLSCLDTPTVQAVLSIGYKKSIVKRIIEHKIKETGSSFPKASLLLEAIHKCPDFEEDVEVSDKDEPRPQTDAVAEAKLVTDAALEKENIMLKKLKLCKICLDEELSVLFLPCGHLVTCARCALALRKCPVCRKNIQGTVEVFFCHSGCF